MSKLFTQYRLTIKELVFLINLSGTVTPGINFKRDITSMPEANGDTCDHSKVVPVLSSVSTNGLDQLRSALVTVMGESWLNTTVAIPQSLENE